MLFIGTVFVFTEPYNFSLSFSRALLENLRKEQEEISASEEINYERLAEVKLEQFRAQRDLQLQADAAQRRAAQNQTHQQSNDVTRGLR